MDGAKRRVEIVKILINSKKPIAGGYLAKYFKVSRQVIVQDIAILRAENKNILSTYKGYLIPKENDKEYYTRSFHVKHSMEDTQDELNIFVDAGASVLDVAVEHRVYGMLLADLILNSRKDVSEFVNKLNETEAKPLMSLSDGTHYHTIKAASEEVLDYIEKELKKKGYLIETEG